jgi:hypothetical protein
MIMSIDRAQGIWSKEWGEVSPNPSLISLLERETMSDIEGVDQWIYRKTV